MAVKSPRPTKTGGLKRSGTAPRPSRLLRALRVPSTRIPGTAEVEFPIVGVGASAGGLEAFSQLLAHLPGDTGMAFVLIQHLAPTHPSLLTPVLAKTTRMVVVEARGGVRVEPNHVYVIPPNASLAIRGRVLALVPREETSRPHMSIDFFFSALAVEEGSRAIGVLLSGAGTDGTEGLRAIQAEGGITFAEDPSLAKFSPMPESAIKAGVVDNVLPIERLAEELARLSRHPYVAVHRAMQPESPAEHRAEGDALARLFTLVRAATGIDLGAYKASTIERRLARRMALRKIASLGEYIGLIEEAPSEARELCKDVFIHVTCFFRDPEAFDALQQQALAEVVRRHKDGSPIRIWVPGCSTGEEVYSIAMCMLELLGDAAGQVPIQIFGSDISAEAIERARSNRYPESAVRDVRAERLKRFFTITDGRYRVTGPVRDLCVFVKHDLARDPPFVKLDLISCRNVLIYFGLALQRRILALFHYCLTPGGFLFLGHAESVASCADLFSTVDKDHNLCTKAGTSRLFGLVPAAERTADIRSGRIGPQLDAPSLSAVCQQADKLMLARYGPPGVLVNERMDIVQIRGRTGPYLELAVGQPDLNLLKLAREGLLADLSGAFQQAKKQLRVVRRERVEVRHEGGTGTVNLEIVPVTVPPAKERFFLVLFEEAAAARPFASAGKREPGAERQTKGAGSDRRQVIRLKAEMAATREYLQSLLDERQRINDDLTSMNEELISSNEELQSSNEELETAKEELQSTNEELTTVNDELQNRNNEVNQVNSDLVNLLASIDVPIIIVGGDRGIRHFTPRAKALMNLIPTDVGRPIDDIKPNVNVGDLVQQLCDVLTTGMLKESEVQDREGHWYRMQIRPYRTIDNVLDGAVLTLLDIDALKRTVTAVEESLDYVTTIVETVDVPLVILDASLRVVSANRAFYEVFGGSAAELQGQSFLGAGWDVGDLRAKLEGILSKQAELEEEVEVEHPPGRRRIVAVSGSATRWAHREPLVLVTLLDVTERAALLVAANQARVEAEQANRTKDQFLATLSHELRTPMTSILLRAARLQRGDVSPASAKTLGAAIERAARVQSRLVNDLLDVARISSGKLKLEQQPVVFATVIEEALETVRTAAEAKGLRLRADVDASTGSVLGDPVRLEQIVWNLLANSIKFTPEGGEVTVTLVRSDGQLRLSVSDTGRGIAPEFLPHVFERFAQAEDKSERRVGGLGLGLALVRELVSLHRGSVEAESRGEGQGATFTVTLPALPGP